MIDAPAGVAFVRLLPGREGWVGLGADGGDGAVINVGQFAERGACDIPPAEPAVIESPRGMTLDGLDVDGLGGMKARAPVVVRSYKAHRPENAVAYWLLQERLQPAAKVARSLLASLGRLLRFCRNLALAYFYL